MKNLFLLLILTIMVLVSCRETGTDETINKNTPVSYDLYVAGNDENNTASYWKNTAKTVLSSGAGCTATKVTVDNTDVYVEGIKIDPSTYTFKYYYWKNNIRYDIEQQLGLQSSDDFKMKDMAFKNGDVYIVGNIKNPASTSTNDAYQLCYWKNGNKTVLHTHNAGTLNAESDIEIINNDIYITATKNYNSGNYDAGYYKNGTYYLLSNTKNFSKFLYDTSGVYLIAKHRQTGALEQYNLTTNIYTAFPSYINPADFRTAEWDNGNKYYILPQYYYKNDTQYNLVSTGSQFMFCDDFKVLNDNVYKILHKDNSGVDYKVYINDVEVLTTTNTGNQNGRFRSLTVIPN
ncbi:hypothetical protein [uncultured Chryseobacterium sp.]|uniref:hypothetical protein n=1 Tax=uncultured Chryseobacterium sp. TaxID=259322 RepID=UPI0025D14A49|nr:hypothetical protein [uncultured Chryseobacterium sp.]